MLRSSGSAAYADFATFAELSKIFVGNLRGTRDAVLIRMGGVRRFEDFHAWRLSVALRDAIFAMTESGRAARDFNFRDQIRDASSSPPRNIAEGFGRYKPKPFAHFLRIARASLLETRNLLREGLAKEYFDAERVDELLRLQARAAKATLKLIQYLENCPDDFDLRSESPDEPQDRKPPAPREPQAPQDPQEPREP